MTLASAAVSVVIGLLIAAPFVAVEVWYFRRLRRR